ncbi:MAG: hypothetical protein WCN85_11700 [Burkholderiales bacterium]
MTGTSAGLQCQATFISQTFSSFCAAEEIARLIQTPVMSNLSPSLTALDPNAADSAALPALLDSVARHRELNGQMIRREVVGRYRGSALGLAWSFFNPVLMLALYTPVFPGIFKARWNTAGEPESIGRFAIVMFVGMLVLNLLTALAEAEHFA